MTRNERMTSFVVVGVAFFMLGLAFASKPLYDAFCRVTGYGGTTQIADSRPKAVLDRTVRVRLDSNVGRDTGLNFRSATNVMEIRLGETGMAFFEVENTTDQPIIAMAGYNVAPHKTGPFFNKLECFCFEERVFNAGETARLPVIFYIDPAMDEDQLLDDVTEITLSYTFYDTHKQGKNQTARLEAAVLPH